MKNLFILVVICSLVTSCGYKSIDMILDECRDQEYKIETMGAYTQLMQRGEVGKINAPEFWSIIGKTKWGTMGLKSFPKDEIVLTRKNGEYYNIEIDLKTNHALVVIGGNSRYYRYGTLELSQFARLKKIIDDEIENQNNKHSTSDVPAP